MKTMKRNRIITWVLLAVLALDCLGITLLVSERHAEALVGSEPLLVALGDSYSSGEGTPPFFGQNSSGKYTGDGNYDWLAHRSEKAWSGKLKIQGKDVKKDKAALNV